MKRRAFLLGSIASSTLACMGSRRSPVTRSPGRTAIEFTLDGHDRRTVLYIPEKTVEKPPLMIAIHGNGGDPSVMSKANGFDEVCEQEGWIGLYPHCNLPEGADDRQGDFRFLDHLLRESVESLDVDLSRIYAVGFSGGGKKCYSLAARASDLISAIAVSGSRMGHRGFEDQFDPNQTQAEKVSVLHIHGRRDSRIPIQGGQDPKHSREGVSMREGLEMWAAYNGCVADKSFKRLPGCPQNIVGHHWESSDGYQVVGLADPNLAHTWAKWANPVVVDFLRSSPRRT